jgi:hypothetical protein
MPGRVPRVLPRRSSMRCSCVAARPPQGAYSPFADTAAYSAATLFTNTPGAVHGGRAPVRYAARRQRGNVRNDFGLRRVCRGCTSRGPGCFARVSPARCHSFCHLVPASAGNVLVRACVGRLRVVWRSDVRQCNTSGLYAIPANSFMSGYRGFIANCNDASR